MNASAVAAYLKETSPKDVSLICIGNSGTSPAPEDELCSRYIQSLLTGEEPDMGKEIFTLTKEPSVFKFFDSKWKDVFPVKDFILCIEYNRFPLVLKAKKVSEDIFEISGYPI